MPQIKDSWDKLIEAMKRSTTVSKETREHIDKDKQSKEDVRKDKRI